MAEFVIKRIDATHQNSGKNTRGCYKRGDIIDVMEDGLADTMPWLTVIKVPQISVEDVRQYMEPITEEFINSDGFPEIRILTRRKYRIPNNVLNNMFPNNLVTQYTVTQAQWDAWKSNIEEKLT